ncbi:hypothetical protein Hanom_Chr04g00372181 [Helianthus anomalus]
MLGGQVKEGNPSSAALTSTGLLGLCCLYVVLFLYRRKFDYFLTLPTVMVDGVLYRFKLRSSESTITGNHLYRVRATWGCISCRFKSTQMGSREVAPQVSDDPPEDTSPSETTSRDATADGFVSPLIGGKRPCEDHPNSA